ncbi:MAG: HAMP domain-containing protein [Hydrogenophilaceae bacterium]|nr:HAMP domain-containing protein [Hydrogenophilaceae bacterium]
MNWLPDSLLARTVWLIAGLLLISQLAWLTLFGLYEREPRAKQIAHRAAAIVNLTRAALLAARPDKRRDLLVELSRKEGVQVIPVEYDEVDVPPPSSPLLARVADEIRRELGEHTLVAFNEEDEEGLWVSFAIDTDEYWVVMPRTGQSPPLPWAWIGWGAGVMLLSVLGAWLMVRRINRPLVDASKAAAMLGQGKTPPTLDEHGPREIATLGVAFNRMKDDLSAMEHNRSLMLAGISHDLRTPLSRLRLAVEMNVSNDRERNAMIRDIEDMDGLTRQFLDFARRESEEAPQEIDISDLVKSMADRFALLGKPITTSGQTCRLHARHKALTRALDNLIENAFRYGASPVAIDIRTEDRQCLISVLDGGPGLAEAELQRVKKPFFRGNSARTNAQGTGLGLAIADRIARLHGGSLTLVNRPEGGLEARLSLPLA